MRPGRPGGSGCRTAPCRVRVRQHADHSGKCVFLSPVFIGDRARDVPRAYHPFLRLGDQREEVRSEHVHSGLGSPVRREPGLPASRTLILVEQRLLTGQPRLRKSNSARPCGGSQWDRRASAECRELGKGKSPLLFHSLYTFSSRPWMNSLYDSCTGREGGRELPFWYLYRLAQRRNDSRSPVSEYSGTVRSGRFALGACQILVKGRRSAKTGGGRRRGSLIQAQVPRPAARIWRRS